jgi:hypothetical protein
MSSKADELRAIFDKMPDAIRLTYARQDDAVGPDGKPVTDPDTGDTVPERVTAVIAFSESGFGFGDIAIVADRDGQTYIDGEGMPRWKIKELLGRLVDSAILDTDPDVNLHAKYKQAMGQQCGLGCPACHGHSEQ